MGIATLLVGVASGWSIGRVNEDRDLRDLVLVHNLETVGLCSGPLTLQTREGSGRIAAILEQRLDSAVGDAAELVKAGARLGPWTPNLRDAERRAAEYYAATEEVAKKQEAESLLARLSQEE